MQESGFTNEYGKKKRKKNQKTTKEREGKGESFFSGEVEFLSKSKNVSEETQPLSEESRND